MENLKIACPKCDWEPDASSQWMCTCGHTWNTFDTGGKCPSCGIQWKDTCCLSCHQWSPHLDWYRNLGDWLVEDLAEVNVEVEELEVV